MILQPSLYLQTNGDRVIDRRTFLHHLGAGAAGAGLLSWHQTVRLHADELRRRGMACILLWMGGGPSQFESFDPKPGTATGGPTKSIATAINGVRIAEGWEQIAKQMKDIAVIRSMTHKEGEHGRASYRLHTGYNPSPAVHHPSFGAIAAVETAPAEADLPAYVRINGNDTGFGAGFLGARGAPFQVSSPTEMPRNLTLPSRIGPERFRRRLELTEDLSADFARAGGRAAVGQQRQMHERASRFILSKDLKVFDVKREPDRLRDRYGRNPFGQGCLLARRLVEAGVTFVEVVSTHPKAPASWDTHIDNFAVTPFLVGWVDPGYAALLADLKDRGLLQRTLVVWMGEFGRTPKINNRGKTGGRDHYPNAFSVALSGGGIKAGQVIGATSADGAAVVQRPVSVADLFCTFCRIFDINPRKENRTSGGLPVKIVDGGEPVKELLG